MPNDEQFIDANINMQLDGNEEWVHVSSSHFHQNANFSHYCPIGARYQDCGD